MILYFSGTGNTRMAAYLLGEALGEKTVEMDMTSEAPALTAEGGRIVWCFPTYSWGVPPVVAEYMRTVRLDGAERMEHHMLTSCGDDMGYTDRQWAALVRGRGWNPKGAYAVVMPNTYVLMKGFNVDSPELAASKLEAVPRRISEVADAIRKGKPDMPVRGSFPWIKSKIIYPWFVRFGMSPKPFHATGGCTGCGLCARSCPCGNIVMADGEPHWGDRCALCLRCYHICPRRSVAYGRATDGKGQYMNPIKTRL